LSIIFNEISATLGLVALNKNLHLNRRKFLQVGSLGVAYFLAGGSARAQQSSAVFGQLSDIGPLQAPDSNGLMLPAGFRSRIVAKSGEPPAGLPGYTWHSAPDGGACFPTQDSGWVYVSNAEMRSNEGGVGALRFDSNGEVVDAYSILANTSINCAGGATPWGTWLSCEEFSSGQVYECDPMGITPATVRPALGTFAHEAAAVDIENNCVYLTEDVSDGGFYRFVSQRGLPDLTAGRLEVASVIEQAGSSYVVWYEVADPLARNEKTRYQVAETTPFAGGEGIAIQENKVFFTTKHDNRVWCYDIHTQEIEVLYDFETSSNPILSGVDNVVITPGGDVLVAEDGGDMQIVGITPDNTIFPLLQIVGQDQSEICGPAFDPGFQRLYFSSQRGTSGSSGGGITYEVSSI